MFLSSLLLASALVPQGPTGGGPTLVINEFQYDDAGTDDLEFIEIYNASGGPINLTGWTLTSSDPSGPNFTIALSSVILPAGGFYVVGDAAVPNVNQTIAAGLMENDNESIALLDPSSTVVDSLIYEANKGISFAPSLAEGEGIWDNHQMVETNSPLSLGRIFDGRDTNDNGRDFVQRRWTPGSSNNVGGSSYANNFDSLAVGGVVPGFDGNFKNPKAIDPTVAGPALGANNLNPNVIPASPQGGNAAIFWDETGGGNVTSYIGAPGTDCSFDGWVYIAPSPVVVAAQAESWSIGVQGTTNGVYNIPDPSGVLGATFIANGNTGFSWTYEATNGGVAGLYLVDHNNGGWGATALSAPTVLASIPVSAGVNDGWQRLKIAVSGSTLEARFGGTVGNPDGTLYSFTITPTVGCVYIGYRELVTANNTLRPLTLDDVRISTCPPAGSAVFGHGSPGSLGVPSIFESAPFVLGGTGGVGLGNMLANDVGIVLIGIRVPPIDLSLAGAPVGAELYLAILTAAGVPTNGSGDANYTLGVPNLTDLCGGELSFQGVQIDVGIPAFLPLSTTMGLTVRIGL